MGLLFKEVVHRTFQKKPLLISISRVLTVIFVFTNVLFAHASEENFWKARKQKNNFHVAAVPAGPVLVGMPFSSPSSLKSVVLNPPIRLSFDNNAGPAQPEHIAGLSSELSRYITVRKFLGQLKKPLLILFEDLHQNTEAQTHLSNALKVLGRGAGSHPLLVALEGARGGFVYDLYRKFPARDLAFDIADAALTAGDISGPAHAGFTLYPERGERGLLFWGVDDPALYLDNVNAYRNSAQQRGASQKKLVELAEALGSEKRNVLSPALRAFDQTVDAYRSGRMPFGDYLMNLARYDVPVSFAVESYLAAWKLEKALNFSQVEVERRTVLKELVKGLNPNDLSLLAQMSLAYQQGNLSFSAYYAQLRNFCLKHGLDLKKTPQFDEYIRYVLLVDGIDSEKLFEDAARMEEVVYSALIGSQKERDVITASRELFLMSKLCQCSLTSQEWTSYQKTKRYYRDLVNMQPFEVFYEAADRRSVKLAENLKSAVKTEAEFVSPLPRGERDGMSGIDEIAAVLVAGGFHTRDLVEALKEDFSVLVVTPKTTKIESDKGNEYLSVFEREKTALEKIFEGRALFVPAAVAGGIYPVDSSQPNFAKTMMLRLLAVSAQLGRVLQASALSSAGTVLGVGHLRVLDGSEDHVQIKCETSALRTHQKTAVNLLIFTQRKLSSLWHRLLSRTVDTFRCRGLQLTVSSFFQNPFSGWVRWMKFWTPNPFEGKADGPPTPSSLPYLLWLLRHPKEVPSARVKWCWEMGGAFAEGILIGSSFYGLNAWLGAAWAFSIMLIFAVFYAGLHVYVRSLVTNPDLGRGPPTWKDFLSHLAIFSLYPLIPFLAHPTFIQASLLPFLGLIPHLGKDAYKLWIASAQRNGPDDLSPLASVGTSAMLTTDQNMMVEQVAFRDRIEKRTRAIFRRAKALRDFWLVRLFGVRGISDRLIRFASRYSETQKNIFYFTIALGGIGRDYKKIMANMADLAKAENRWLVRIPTALVLWIVTLFSATADVFGWLILWVVKNIMAKRFFIGEQLDQAMKNIEILKQAGLSLTVDNVGELSLCTKDTEHYVSGYVRLTEKGVPAISIKLSNLTPHFNPNAWERTKRPVKEQMRKIIEAAKRVDGGQGAEVTIDMEEYIYKDLTIEILLELLEETHYPKLGIAIQAYLKDARADLEKIVARIKERGLPKPLIRLVKGANKVPDGIGADAEGRSIPQFNFKAESDINFDRCAEFMFEQRQFLRLAFGTHNLRSMAVAIELADQFGVKGSEFELQFLHGMVRPEVVRAIREINVHGEKVQVRLYAPFGPFIRGLGYFVRRLVEKTDPNAFLLVEGYGRRAKALAVQDPRVVARTTEVKTAAPAATKRDPIHPKLARGLEAAKRISQSLMNKGEPGARMAAIFSSYRDEVANLAEWASRSLLDKRGRTNELMIEPRGQVVFIGEDPDASDEEIANWIAAPIASGNSITIFLKNEDQMKRFSEIFREAGVDRDQVDFRRYRQGEIFRTLRRGDIDSVVFQGADDESGGQRVASYHRATFSNLSRFLPGNANYQPRTTPDRNFVSAITPDYTKAFLRTRVFSEFTNRAGFVTQAVGKIAKGLLGFKNTSHLELFRLANQEALMAEVKSLGERSWKTDEEVIPVVIDGRLDRKLGNTRPVRSAADPSQTIGRMSLGSANDVELAVRVARREQPSWEASGARSRAEILLKFAELAEKNQLRLTALLMWESGKTAEEASADIEEGIDFARFYALDAIREEQEEAERTKPGSPWHGWRTKANGVSAVISPWNFPFAIPAGQIISALAAGNTVVFKPSAESPHAGYEIFKLLQEAGIPSGVVNFLPGKGEGVGQSLVTNPDVDEILFTGSAEVGLEIKQKAAELYSGKRPPKHVIAEMGGNNAIIIDEGTDIDQAIKIILASAFGYSKQKCSACNRVIVVKGAYPQFRDRLKQAAEALVEVMGDPRQLGTVFGPLISDRAREEMRRFMERVEAMGAQVLAEGRSATSPVAFKIYEDVQPSSPLAQEEQFFPTLSLMQADSFEEAVRLLNDTPYALTGGLISQNSSHIEYFRSHVKVGNATVNGKITGAMVGQQSFGGSGLSGFSGFGSKAGGMGHVWYHRHWVKTEGPVPHMRTSDAPSPSSFLRSGAAGLTDQSGSDLQPSRSKNGSESKKTINKMSVVAILSGAILGSIYLGVSYLIISRWQTIIDANILLWIPAGMIFDILAGTLSALSQEIWEKNRSQESVEKGVMRRPNASEGVSWLKAAKQIFEGGKTKYAWRKIIGRAMISLYLAPFISFFINAWFLTSFLKPYLMVLIPFSTGLLMVVTLALIQSLIVHLIISPLVIDRIIFILGRKFSGKEPLDKILQEIPKQFPSYIFVNGVVWTILDFTVFLAFFYSQTIGFFVLGLADFSWNAFVFYVFKGGDLKSLIPKKLRVLERYIEKISSFIFEHRHPKTHFFALLAGCYILVGGRVLYELTPLGAWIFTFGSLALLAAGVSYSVIKKTGTGSEVDSWETTEIPGLLKIQRPGAPRALSITTIASDMDDTFSISSRGWMEKMKKFLLVRIMLNPENQSRHVELKEAVSDYVDEFGGPHNDFDHVRWMLGQGAPMKKSPEGVALSEAETIRQYLQEWLNELEEFRRENIQTREREANTIPGVRRFFESAKGVGMRLVVNSGYADAGVKEEIRRLNMEGLFDEKDRHGASSEFPSKASILKQLIAEGIPPSQMIMMGDTLGDIRQGLEAGVITVLFIEGNLDKLRALATLSPEKRPHYVVTDFSKDPDGMARFFAGRNMKVVTHSQGKAEGPPTPSSFPYLLWLLWHPKEVPSARVKWCWGMGGAFGEGILIGSSFYGLNAWLGTAWAFSIMLIFAVFYAGLHVYVRSLVTNPALGRAPPIWKNFLFHLAIFALYPVLPLASYLPFAQVSLSPFFGFIPHVLNDAHLLMKSVPLRTSTRIDTGSTDDTNAFGRSLDGTPSLDMADVLASAVPVEPVLSRHRVEIPQEGSALMPAQSVRQIRTKTRNNSGLLIHYCWNDLKALDELAQTNPSAAVLLKKRFEQLTADLSYVSEGKLGGVVLTVNAAHQSSIHSELIHMASSMGLQFDPQLFTIDIADRANPFGVAAQLIREGRPITKIEVSPIQTGKNLDNWDWDATPYFQALSTAQHQRLLEFVILILDPLTGREVSVGTVLNRALKATWLALRQA